MKRFVISLLALGLTMGAAWADECTYENNPPSIPDAETATAEERTQAIADIKAYQQSLAPYRECLDAIIQDKDNERDERQAALDKFNESVDWETEVVEAWVAFDAAYKKKNEDG